MIKDGYGGVKMCRVQAGQTMSTAAPRRHGDAQLVPGAALSHFDKDGKGGDTCLFCSFDQFFGFFFVFCLYVTGFCPLCHLFLKYLKP